MKTVVVVDDEFDIADAVQALLQGEGYKVIVYQDGRTAFDGLTAGDSRVHLLLVDVMMPRMDGMKLLEALRSTGTFNDTPMVLMSALRPKEPAESRPPWNAFLQKPFSLGTLLRTVEKQIGRP